MSFDLNTIEGIEKFKNEVDKGIRERNIISKANHRLETIEEIEKFINEIEQETEKEEIKLERIKTNIGALKICIKHLKLSIERDKNIE